MSRFGPDPLQFFTTVYNATPPWEIGAPQPAMAALLDKYPPAGPILDVGCASGDLSIALAALGHRVVGIDFVPAAIESAKAKASGLPLAQAALLYFRVADALKPSVLDQQFGAVVDSGFYHLFNPDVCAQYVEELARVLVPQGRLYLHEFAIGFEIPNVPRHIRAEELQANFSAGNGWRILEIQAVEFHSRVAAPVPGICACIERM